MKIGSHYSYHKGSASIDSNKADAKLNFRELTPGAMNLSKDDTKDTLELSDGAKVHIAQSLAGPDGVGDGTNYGRIVSFLRKSLENSLGTKVRNINIDGLEVDSQTKTLATRTATPNETQGAISYQTTKTNITIQENSINVQGIVRTRDGQELGFDLSIDITTVVGSQTNMRYFGTGDAAKETPMIAFDGVARELSDISFQFDSDPSSGLLAGKGTCCIRKADNEKVNTGFRRYNWQA